MASVFIKVPISERLPKEIGDYYSNIGRVYFKPNKFYLRDEQVITKTSSVVWFLEEIEVPTEKHLDETDFVSKLKNRLEALESLLEEYVNSIGEYTEEQIRFGDKVKYFLKNK